MKIGRKVEVQRTVDLLPDTVLQKGETGVVREMADVYGQPYVSIQLDTYHPGLTRWGNCALLAGDDMGSVALRPRLPEGAIWRMAAALLVGVTLAAGAEVVSAKALHVPSTIVTLIHGCMDFDCSN